MILEELTAPRGAPHTPFPAQTLPWWLPAPPPQAVWIFHLHAASRGAQAPKAQKTPGDARSQAELPLLHHQIPLWAASPFAHAPTAPGNEALGKASFADTVCFGPNRDADPSPEKCLHWQGSFGLAQPPSLPLPQLCLAAGAEQHIFNMAQAAVAAPNGAVVKS